MTTNTAPVLTLEWDVEIILPGDPAWPADVPADDDTTVFRDIKTGFVWVA